MKFIADRSLGKLVKWLRILGYDTLYYSGDADREFLKKAHAEGRVALTRKRDLMKRQFMGRMLMIEADHVEGQLRTVVEHLQLRPDPADLFSRCLKCNEALIPFPREKARENVPPYTYETHEKFMICPECGKVFWPGTHKERAENFLRKRIRTDRP